MIRREGFTDPDTLRKREVGEVVRVRRAPRCLPVVLGASPRLLPFRSSFERCTRRRKIGSPRSPVGHGRGRRLGAPAKLRTQMRTEALPNSLHPHFVREHVVCDDEVSLETHDVLGRRARYNPERAKCDA